MACSRWNTGRYARRVCARASWQTLEGPGRALVLAQRLQLSGRDPGCVVNHERLPLSALQGHPLPAPPPLLSTVAQEATRKEGARTPLCPSTD
eukprot:2352900-Amphidinium_carterae.1